MPQPVPTSPPLLSARALRFSRNDMPAFGPVDFAVAAGEALRVQGESGAGKTTPLTVRAAPAPARRGRRRARGPPPPPDPARPRGGLPRPPARADGGPHRAGEPALPLRAARPARGQHAGARDGDRGAGRLRGRDRAADV